mgnify:CR=1 FL=1
MAILTICCLWIVTDVAYGVRMWELGVDAWIGRITVSYTHLTLPTTPYV